jgi:L-cystine transport system substrate-binding protein
MTEVIQCLDMNKKKNAVALGTIVVLAAMLIVGCGSNKEEKEPKAVKDNTDTSAEETTNNNKVIHVGYSSSGYPLAYKDEDGNLTGYELEVLKLADEQLDNYTFEYSEATQDALYAGLTAGKYDLVVSNAFYTEERAEKFILPDNPFGASLVGMILRKDQDQVKTFEDAAKKNLSLAPILAGDGLYYVIYQFNEENQDQQIKLEATDNTNAFIDSVSWVAEGRYDFAAWPKNYWEQIVKSNDGTLHEYFDQVQFVECRSVYTYPVISKENEDLAKTISPIFKALYEDGTLTDLSKQFYGYDAFQYASE